MSQVLQARGSGDSLSETTWGESGHCRPWTAEKTNDPTSHSFWHALECSSPLFLDKTRDGRDSATQNQVSWDLTEDTALRPSPYPGSELHYGLVIFPSHIRGRPRRPGSICHRRLIKTAPSDPAEGCEHQRCNGGAGTRAGECEGRQAWWLGIAWLCLGSQTQGCTE